GAARFDDPNVWLARGALLIVLLGGAYLVYRLFRAGTAHVVSISSPYRSSTGVTVELPGRTGWHSDPGLRVRQSFSTGWLRGDVMFRARTAADADQFAMVMRVHVPGGFAHEVDPERMRTGLEASLRQAAAQAGAEARGLACAYDTSWRSGQAVACYGRVVLPARELPGGAYLWVENDDDVIGIAYASSDGALDPLEQMARTAR
ncbi:MAG TPA: hypothetical protein VHE35_11375, partial [Kofleriaceae bacterium]|nr:hypothetical protein [Kofleriaceae bacterium]